MVQEDIYNEDASFCVSEHFVLRFGTFRFADYIYLFNCHIFYIFAHYNICT